MKQFGVALHGYASANQDKLPGGMSGGLSGNPQYASSPFFYTMLPHIEQDNIYKAVGQSGASWGSAAGVNGQTVVVKTYLCPSDSSHNSGTGPNTGWTVTSYQRNYYMFDTASQPSGNGHYYTVPKYTVANIPDGTSNTVGITERFAYVSASGYSNLWSHHAQERIHWGYSQWSSAYPHVNVIGGGIYGVNANTQGNDANIVNFPPRVGEKSTSTLSNFQYYPSSGHSSGVQTLMMDGSVRNVGAGISGATWRIAILADDGQVMGSDW
jgi:hypothetical protein